MQNVQQISPQGNYLSYIIPAGDADPSSRGTASVCALLSYGPLCAPIPPTSSLSSVLRLLFHLRHAWPCVKDATYSK